MFSFLVVELLVLFYISVVAGNPLYADSHLYRQTVLDIPTGLQLLSVKVPRGIVIGTTDHTVDNFLGISFTKPLFVAGATTHRTINAIKAPPMCHWSRSPTPSWKRPIHSKDKKREDCMTLDIQRPAGLKLDPMLPVAIGLYDGNCENGSSSSHMVAEVVKKSVALGEPHIFVTMNCLGKSSDSVRGHEIQIDEVINDQLRDQKLLLQWVRDNIRSFGGDPTNVAVLD